MRNYFNSALNILSKVFVDGSYSNRAISHAVKVDDMTTKLVYGVLEKNITLEYVLSQLLKKKPDQDVYILLKIGAYSLLYLDNVPDFAIVSECVEVTKIRKMSGLSGFVNAVLKKVARKEYSLPTDKNSAEYASVYNSIPLWFVKRIKKEYGDIDFSAECTTLETARINTNITSLDEVTKKLDENKIHYEVIEGFNALLVPADERAVKKLFNDGYITFQSLSSQMAVKTLDAKDGSQILDMCSAPGGKGIYIAEICKNSNVILTDIYEHRVALIEKYVARMHTKNITAKVFDGTKDNAEFNNKFDFVLLDAPCSCFGTYKKHPDVFLQHNESNIKSLAQTQKKLILQAIEHLKVGGQMVYSTCTLFNEENIDIVSFALSTGKVKLVDIPQFEEYSTEKGIIKVLPHGAFDGFFIAKLEKIK